MNIGRLPIKESKENIVKLINDIFNYITSEFNKLERIVKDKTQEEEIINKKKYHPLGGDVNTKITASRLKLKPINPSDSDIRTIYVDKSDEILYYRDNLGVDHPLY